MRKWIMISTMCIGLFCRCKDKYVSPYHSPNVGYLVVEGLISGNTPIQYTLTRTLPLPGDTTIPKETGANVEVEGSDGSSIPLTEQTGGVYSSLDTPRLNTAVQYRLRIHTPEGEDYLSSFVPFRPTPAIDSVNWLNGNAGLNIYVNTHDPTNATRYYEWNFVETWEYHSALQTTYEYDTAAGKVIYRPAADQIYTCWHTDTATNVLVGTSIKLAQDVIYEQQLQLLQENSVQASVLYSILVYQWALTDSAYNYMSILQRNTESLGSIFDVQPSVLAGNIHCLTHPAEQVIGYISAGTLQQQRIFIYDTQLPSWRYEFGCENPDSNIKLDSVIERKAFAMGGFIPIAAHITPPAVQADGWTSNVVGCIDCRAQGGVTTRPPLLAGKLLS